MSGSSATATAYPRCRGRSRWYAGRPAAYYLVLLDAPAPGHGFVAAEGDGDTVMVSSYLYLYGAAGAALPDQWTPRFLERFPLAAS